ncbi:MAG: hypothetical protein JNN28_01520, partial [Saprospiraceae bacterium]|nr:hypothetical protein [Saprospiraceae bacterium]
MKLITQVLALLLLTTSITAQTLVISTQNPDGLFVCGNDQITVTLQNGAGPAAANLKTTITFPPGIT